MEKSAKVVVVGQGYVGLPLAMRAVEVGYDVVGSTSTTAGSKRLAAGESYVEDISDERARPRLATGRYRSHHPTTPIAGFDVAVITVPTPLRDGAPDLALHRAVRRRTLAGTCGPGDA